MVKISKYAIVIDLKIKDQFLLVNGLYGYVDVVSKRVAECIYDWSSGSVDVTNREEKVIYDFLVARRYIMCESEETRFRLELEKRLIKRHMAKINSSLIATFIPSYSCNFACPYCFERDVQRNSPIISKEQVDAVFALYPGGHIPYIRLYGGEPLLPEHNSIIEYIIEKGNDSEFSVVTNGYYLEEFIPLFTGKKIRSFQITFDGAQDTHDRTRVLCDGGATFEKIISGVEKAVENVIPIRIRMNISKDNIDSCYEFKTWLENRLKNAELLTFEMQGLFDYDKQEALDITGRILEESSRGKPNSLLQTMPSLARFVYDGTSLKPTISACEYGDGDRIFDPYGDIYTCYLGVGNKNKRIGTYYPTVELFEGNMLQRNALNIDRCYNCRYVFLCGGGCPNPLISKDGNCMAPNCTTMYNLMENIIPMIYKWKTEEGEVL